MEKRVMFLLFVFVVGFVCAQGWGDISTESDASDSGSSLSGILSTATESGQEDAVEGVEPEADDVKFVLGSKKGETRLTANFYIALGVGFVGLLIVALFLWLWIRGPRNKWKKKR